MNQRHLLPTPRTAATTGLSRTCRPHLPLLGWLTLFILACIPTLANASVTAQVDRNSINEGDTFTLTLSVSGDNHAQPDLSALRQNFDVLGTGQKSMIQIINGSVSSNRSWTITLSPKHTGKLTIPPITVGSDHSNTLSVTVLPATAASGGSTHQAAVFLEVSVKPAHKSYVQAQLLYTVHLYYAEPLQQGTLSAPSLNNAIVQKLGKDSHFTTIRGNRQYQVIERRYAIFPQHSGELKIAAVVFDGRVNDPSAQTGNPFFDSFNPPTRHVHLRSRTLDVQVASQPANYQGNNWLPAQDIQLQEKWSPHNPTFRVGEPVTRNIIIHAKGLSSSQLPDLPLPQQAAIKLYPDQAQTHDKPDGDTLDATREQKIAIIPTRAGNLTLPAIHLTWWDTKTQRQRTTSLPAETIHVLPAAASSNTAIAPTATNPRSTTAATNTKVTKTQAPKQPVSQVKTSTQQTGMLKASIWMVIALSFAVAWIITGWLWWRQRRPLANSQKDTETPMQASQQASIKQLRLACQQHNAQSVKRALLDWAQARWPDNPPLSLGAMAKRIHDKTLFAQISELDKILYTPAAASDWRAEGLLASFTSYCKHLKLAGTASNDNELEPLYLHKERAG